jgi:hypothetical protein
MSDSIKKRLRRLTGQELTSKQYKSFMDETHSETNHRGAAILIAVNLELALDYALSGYFVPSRMSKLFGVERPLSGFWNKILVAYALNVFGDEVYHNLDLIRNIRNSFAHAHVPISFDTKEIADACAALKMPKVVPPHMVGANERDVSTLAGLPRYREICERCGHILLWRRMKISKELQAALEALKDLDPEFTRIIARSVPLP